MELERSSFEPHWRELNQFLSTRTGRFLSTDRNKGTRRNQNMFDNSALRARRVLSAGLLAGATSPARPWFRLGLKDTDVAKYSTVKVWLNQVTNIILDVFQQTNTYRALQQLYDQLGCFGTGISVMMDDYDTIIHHSPLAIGEGFLATDYKNEANALGRKFDKTILQTVAEFKYENCSSTVKNAYDNGNYDKWVTLVHLIEPNVERDYNSKLAKNMPFKSCYFEYGRDELMPSYLRESGLPEFQVLAPRWDVESDNDIYGTLCPGMEALGDVKQLQHEQLRKAEGIDYQTKPPIGVPTSMKNKEIDRLPGGVSYIDGQSTSKIGNLFDVNLRLDYLLADIKDVRERIDNAFFVDLFLMISQIEAGKMTATETGVRQEEKMLMLGPVLERMHNELFSRLIKMTFHSLLRARQLPPPPPEMHGNVLNIEFISMLAQAQRAIATNGIDRFIGTIGQIAVMGGGVKADVLDKLNTDKTVDVYAEALGVDPELITSNEDVAVIRQGRQQAQQQAQQAAVMQAGSESAKNLAQAPTDNKNALTDVMRMFSGYSTPQQTRP